VSPDGRVSWSRIFVQALVAGIAGAILIDLYLWVTTLLPHHAGIGVIWRFIASTVLGKSALTAPGSALIGACIHLIVSLGWAGGYAYIATAHPATTQRWLVAGIVYGLVVYTIMQVILLADNNFTYPPTPNAFLNALVAHAVFFGLPVAYIVHVMQRQQPA
jgi:hypothetical protein